MKRLALRLALCTLAAFSFSAVPSFAWWYLVDGRVAEASTITIDIVPGTAEQIASGSQPPSLPKDLQLAPRDSLLIRNLDAVTHQLGSVSIPAGGERLVSASVFVTAGQSRFLCTFHSAGTLSLTAVEGASPMGALIVTLVVTLPLSLAAFAVLSVTERLEEAEHGNRSILTAGKLSG